MKDTQPVTYTIEDTKGKEIQGTFYQPELQKANREIYRFEKVLRKKENNGIKEIYVKWKGYSNDFNSWMPAGDLA